MSTPKKFVALEQIPTRRYALAALLASVMIAACGSPPKPTFHGLPANVMAHPRGMVAAITLPGPGPSNLLTSLRALGIPYRHVPLDKGGGFPFSPYKVVILEEGVLGVDKDFALYRNVLQHVTENGATLILLRQDPKVLIRAAMMKLPYRIHPREVDYRLMMSKPRREDPVVVAPNTITRADLDSMSTRVQQLVFGGEEARAILATNLDAPDSSATLLWEPYGRGTIWYVSFPLSEYAAVGREAEQKLLANILSNK